MTELAVVVWKWTPAQPSGPRFFHSSHVNVLRAMVERNLSIQHRFVCITDDPEGLDRRIEAMPLPAKFDTLVSPHQQRFIGRRRWAVRKHGEEWYSTKYFPSCYRRLWNFSSAARCLGDRILALDIDTVVTGRLEPLAERSESFIGWCDEKNERPRVAGGVYLLRTGSHTEVWDQFDPTSSPQVALDAGYKGSDQAWMSHMLCPGAVTWGRQDGLTKLTWLKREPDEQTRLVFTAGHSPPWNHDVQRRYPWILKHWKL